MSAQIKARSVATEADFASYELIPDTVDWNVLYGDDSIIPERARSIVKTIIVRLALKGWIPYRLAEVLIQRGGLRHV